MDIRRKVRYSSFIIAAFAASCGFAFQNYTSAMRYREQLEFTYQRALVDLGDQMTDISATLNKGIYSSSSSHLSSLSAKLLRDCAAAKASLSQLPVSDFHLDNTYRFISQAGEYAMSLTRKLAAEGKITSEEIDNLAALSGYAAELRDHVNAMKNDIDLGGMNIGEVVAAVNEESDNADGVPRVTDGFTDMEQSFEGYPMLIYDGPFSDHLLERKPLLIKDKGEVTAENAKRVAARALNIDPSQLTADGNEDGDMASYVFSYNEYSAAVTKRGGVLCYVMSPRIGAEEYSVSADEAAVAAEKYLAEQGFTSMVKTYYDTNEGICVFNFAYEKDGIICYTDLVKVGVAMDTGEVIEFDARGYISNHYERTVAKPKITKDEAIAKVSKGLKPQTARLAVIPTSGANEAFTYEVLCKGRSNENILVYINAQSGEEEQILMLIETETGVLTM